MKTAARLLCFDSSQNTTQYLVVVGWRGKTFSHGAAQEDWKWNTVIKQQGSSLHSSHGHGNNHQQQQQRGTSRNTTNASQKKSLYHRSSSTWPSGSSKIKRCYVLWKTFPLESRTYRVSVPVDLPGEGDANDARCKSNSARAGGLRSSRISNICWTILTAAVEWISVPGGRTIRQRWDNKKEKNRPHSPTKRAENKIQAQICKRWYFRNNL